jgi:MarR-like DNA-binding transcriptional regulator SgrR of sgrS sRNA
MVAGTAVPGLGNAWRFEIDTGATWADGAPVGAGDIVASWDSARRRGSPAARWLLEPVAVDGLRADGDALVVRLDRSTPDLLERIAHPALAVWKADDGSGYRGAGRFRPAIDNDGALVAVPRGTDRALLDRVDLVPASSANARLLARLGEIDIAVVYGRSASAFFWDGSAAGDLPHDGSAGPAAFAIRRLPAWDRTYLLWLHPSKRWTRDPGFRRWLSDHVDRTAMMRYLFDGLGAWPCDLLSDCGPEVAGTDDARGPGWVVPRGLRPRITLAYESTDRIASDIAARIKADLDGAGVALSLDPRGREDLDRALKAGELQAAVSFQRPWTDDPVLALSETLRAAGPGFDDAIAALDEASLEPPGSERRVASALEVQDGILRADRLVPLARVDAWIAVAPGLVLRPGIDPSLDIARAGWLP